MKHLITLTLILSSYLATSQSNFIFGVNAGVAIDNNEAGFTKANSIDINNSLYDNNISYVEISVSSTDYSSLPNSYFKTAGSVTFKYFYPTYSTDSIKKKYSGNLFGFDLLGINALPTVNFVDFVVSGGLNMGSKKVRINKEVKYKNFVFAPRLTSELRFVIGDKLTISGKAEKQFDVSKARWKLKKGDDVLQLEGFKYNPLMLSVGLGWKL